MPPKSKSKKKKKGKGSKSGGTKRKDEEILSFTEAVLLCQLEAKKRQHEDLLNSIEDLQRRVRRQKDRYICRGIINLHAFNVELREGVNNISHTWPSPACLIYGNMKFSIEEILKKDCTSKRTIYVGYSNYPKCDSDSDVSIDRSRNLSTDLSSAESVTSDLSDDVFLNKSQDLQCRKRTRTVITRQHKTKLELIFHANRYQSRLDLAEIARNIGLSQHVVKNKSLNNEKQKYLNEAIRKAKEHEIELQKKTEVTYEKVEAALKEKLAAASKKDGEVQDLKNRISILAEEIRQANSEVIRYEEFRDRLRFENEKHVELLKKEMIDMEESYKELANFFVKNLENIKLQIERSTKENINIEKKLASEQALESLDNSSHQEFSDNKWLLQEIQIHKEHLKELSSIVEDLEEKNVEMMGELLSSQFEDVRISKEFFSACNDSESNDDDGDNDDDDYEEVQSTLQLDKNIDNEDTMWLDNYFDSFDDDVQENPKLTSYDLQLLCIVGKKKLIHQELSEKDKERIESLGQDSERRHLVWMSNNFT